MAQERGAAPEGADTGGPGLPVDRERARLTGMAHRVLGTVAEAEEAVQEAYLRWYRLDGAERGRVVNPAAWLTRVTGRICLDLLNSARVRRERYVGPWLPEPVPEGTYPGVGDGAVRPVAMAPAAEPPWQRAVVNEEVGAALLVVMESMTPAERVVFVMHDVFAVPFAEIARAVDRTPAATRQLARSARGRPGAGRRTPADRAEHARVVAAFGAACRDGDLARLVALLDPAAVLRSDGGGVVRAARRPVSGALAAGRFLVGVLAKNPTLRLEPVATADGPGHLLVADGTTVGVLTLGVHRERVTEVWIQQNPAKLTRWPRTRALPDAAPRSDPGPGPAAPRGRRRDRP